VTQQLRVLEADGIAHRKVYATVPPKVDYSVTEYGQSLKRALRALCDWGCNHMERIGASEFGAFEKPCLLAFSPYHATRKLRLADSARISFGIEQQLHKLLT
jgi:hypothetical protein